MLVLKILEAIIQEGMDGMGRHTESVLESKINQLFRIERGREGRRERKRLYIKFGANLCLASTFH